MIGGCSSLKISLAVLSAGHLFRMYSNVPIHTNFTLRRPPGSRLRRPTISSYLLRAAAEQHVIFTAYSFYSAADSAVHYFIYAVLVSFATYTVSIE